MPLTLYPQSPGEQQNRLAKIADTQQQVRQARRTITPQMAFQAAAIASAYPHVDGGQVTGLAIAGQMPGSPTAEAVSERQILQTQTSDVSGGGGSGEGWFDNFVYDPFKGLIRTGFTIFNAGIEELESMAVRAPIGFAQGHDGLAASGRSDAFHALSNAFSGEAVNLGEGFFPNSTVTEDVQKMLSEGVSLADAMAASEEQRKLGTPVTEEGRLDRERLKITHSSGKAVPISFGRAAAINFTEPGTRGFQYLSGFADAFKQIALDPADLALGGLGKVRKLSKLVGNTDSANILSQAARKAMLGTGPRKTFFGTSWNEYLTSNQGSRFAQRITDATGDEGYGQIYDLYKGSQGAAHVDPTHIRKLADNTDHQETLRLIQEFGESQTAGFKKFGRVGFGAEASGSAFGNAMRLGQGPVAGPGGKLGITPQSALRAAPAVATAGLLAPGFGIQSAATGLIKAFDIPMAKMIADTYDTGLGFAVRQSSMGTYLGRLAASTGSRTINVMDRIEGNRSLDQYLRSLGIKKSEYNRLMYKSSDMDGEWAKAIEAAKPGDEPYTQFAHFFGIVKEANQIWADGLRLSNANVSEEALDSIGQMFDSHDALRKFWVNNMGDDVLFGGARVTYLDESGEVVAMPSALLFSQFLEQNIPLMDQRKVRSLQRRSWWADKAKTERVKKMFGADDAEKIGNSAIVATADWANSKLWKPSVLLRFAWPVRVIGEEQFRLSGAMLSGAFNHPMQFMTLMLTKDTKVLGKFSRMGNDALGRAFIDAASHDAALSKSLDGLQGGTKTSRWEAVNKGDLPRAKAAEAHVNTVNQMRNDELTRVVAGRIHDHLVNKVELSLQDIKDAFWSGEYEHLRRALVADSSRMSIMGNKVDADAYIDEVYAHLVHQSGGRGKMLNRHTNQWLDFDGQEIPASEVFKQKNAALDPTPMTETQEAFQASIRSASDEAADALDSGIDSYRVTEGLVDQIEKALPPDMSREIAEDLLNDLAEELEAVQTGDDIRRILDDFDQKMNVTQRRVDAVPQTGVRENIPSQEVQDGHAKLTQRGNRVVNSDMDIQKMDDAASDVAKADDIYRNGLIGKQLEELQNIPAGEYRTYTMDMGSGGGSSLDDWEDFAAGAIDFDDPLSYGAEAGSVKKLTITYGEGGVALSVTEWTKMEDGSFVIDFMGGIDNKAIGEMMKGMREAGDITATQALKIYVGDERLIDWMRRAADDAGTPMPPNIKNYEQMHRWIGENPDAIKAIDEAMKDYKIAAKHSEMASMTTSGAGMMREAALPAKAAAVPGGHAREAGVMSEAAGEAGQHTEYFQLDELGDPRMYELIATGEVVGDGFKWGDNAVGPNTRKQFKERSGYFDEDGWYETMPQYVRRPIDDANPEKVSNWDKAVGYLFESLMSKPTNFLSRSPAYRQFYWQRMAVLYQHADDGVRDSIRLQAKAAGLTDDGILKLGAPVRALRRASGREVAMDEVIRKFGSERVAEADVVWKVGDNVDATLKEMDEIAKSLALEETKTLLYDMSNDHNWSDMARNVMPFAEAWFEVMTTWGRLISENPRNLRRMQQAYQGAKGSDPFQGTGPDGEQGRGLFFRDPNTGEEVFSYPGSGIIANWMMGDAADGITFTGRVSGLSLATQVLPGMGPMVQIPMSQMGWVDDPDKREMRNLILPFGKSKVDIKDPRTWLSPIVPAWVNKGTAALFGDASQGENKRLHANTTMDVYKTLLMQGWSDNTEEDMKRTLDEASRIAQRVYAIKTLASFAGPVSAGELWEISYDHADTHGELWAYQNLATAYRELLDEFQGDDVQAYKKFTDLFGVDPTLFTTAKTQRVQPKAVTLEARRWEHDNKELHNIDMFPNTAYYGQPDPTDGTFDYETYIYQLREGTREPLTPTQWAMRRNTMLGRVAYANFQRQADRRIGDTAQRQQWLRQQHAQLRQFFPGYGRTIPGLPATADLNTQIDELKRWEGEPRLASTDAGQGLAIYLQARERIVRRWQWQFGKTETGWRTGVNGALYRRQLRSLGERLSDPNGDYPGFLPLYNQILSRELAEPEAGQKPITLAGVDF